jgi:benzoyl-CoA reductase/2-hydroxyglutaryl-CoA dehydratase subunit BcrC/BadD/HgdB
MMEAFNTFQKYYQERWNYQLIAEEWKEKGGKVIGYSDVNCPEEIIMAAGCLPLLMTGNPENDIQVSCGHLEYPSSLPIRYLYEAIISGKYDFVDLICLIRDDKWVSLYEYLSAEKLLNPALQYGDLNLIEKPRTVFNRHRDYYYNHIVKFKQFLENYSGKKITDEALTEAIEITNETKRLLKQLSYLRKTEPPTVSGCEALPIYMASMLMPKSKYNILLKQFLESEVKSLPPKDASKIRLFVSGSIMDNLNLYEILESAPAIIVGEDNVFGDGYADFPISKVLKPMEAVAERYFYKTPDPWMLGMRERIEYRVNSAVSAKAQGEIFFEILHDGGLGWDYPDQKKELEKNNIPVLLLEGQEYKIKNQMEILQKISNFVEAIKSRRSGGN